MTDVWDEIRLAYERAAEPRKLRTRSYMRTYMRDYRAEHRHQPEAPKPAPASPDVQPGWPDKSRLMAGR